jgi:hypothetical protein
VPERDRAVEPLAVDRVWAVEVIVGRRHPAHLGAQPLRLAEQLVIGAVHAHQCHHPARRHEHQLSLESRVGGDVIDHRPFGPSVHTAPSTDENSFTRQVAVLFGRAVVAAGVLNHPPEAPVERIGFQ